ncbi:MAG: hypothetical protein PHV03_06710 [Desulfitobacteriaceae bacterium]|nr:hypothetical protein [Desulfitobacteriaceae bacterium]MDD4401683.1 hypothetical protein [Desulfitobacteriaceae bacterium]
MARETALRAGIIACTTVLHEEDFLLAGILFGNRLSNGAKTVIYYIAPDFSLAFLRMITKIGGVFSVRAIYWREKLSPSLYLIPDKNTQNTLITSALAEKRPDWESWGKNLNPVAQQQLKVVQRFFESLKRRRIRVIFKFRTIVFLWGNFEIAEVRRKGKKFELMTKIKWEKDQKKAAHWMKTGWVDANGNLNADFRNTVQNIINSLETLEKDGGICNLDLLSLWLNNSEGVLTSIWGSSWEWPWLAKERGEGCVNELSQLYYFQGNGQICIVCPILERPMLEACRSILLVSFLEISTLLSKVKGLCGEYLEWDRRIHWLVLPEFEENLRLWHSWLRVPEQFQIWSLPVNWRTKGLSGMISETTHMIRI